MCLLTKLAVDLKVWWSRGKQAQKLVRPTAIILVSSECHLSIAYLSLDYFGLAYLSLDYLSLAYLSIDYLRLEFR